MSLVQALTGSGSRSRFPETLGGSPVAWCITRRSRRPLQENGVAGEPSFGEGSLNPRGLRREKASGGKRSALQALKATSTRRVPLHRPVKCLQCLASNRNGRRDTLSSCPHKTWPSADKTSPWMSSRTQIHPQNWSKAQSGWAGHH